MTTITLEKEWIKQAQLFGDVEEVIKDALQAYFIKESQQQVYHAAAQIKTYHQKYQCDYHIFKERVQTDEEFLAKVEHQNPFWEQDAMEWEYWCEEYQTWHTHLNNISHS